MLPNLVCVINFFFLLLNNTQFYKYAIFCQCIPSWTLFYVQTVINKAMANIYI